MSRESLRLHVMPLIYKHKRHGILYTGLWKLGDSKEKENVLTPMRQARLSHATSIRSVVLNFRMLIDADLVPFVSHGGVAYSFNFFLLDFHTLKRVELELPYRASTGDEEANLLRQKRLSDSIELGNSRLGTGAKLSRITAFYFSQDEFDGIHDQTVDDYLAQDMFSRDEWFWQADEEYFLTSKKRSTNGTPSGITTPAIYQYIEAFRPRRIFVAHEALNIRSRLVRE
jgi:hypothetical protein